MSPLIALALRLFPTIMDGIVGDRSKKVTEAIEKVVSTAAGSTDPQVVEQRLKEDPALAVKLQIELAQIARDEKKIALDAETDALNARLSAEADARKTALSSDIEAYKAQLAQTASAQKAELDRRIQDLENTRGARSFQGNLIDQKSRIAYVPAALSLVVTVGFFVVLGLFVFMKGRLEAPVFPSIPEGVEATLSALRPDQLAALIPPRSDFVMQIINISVGSLTAAFATVISYWLGSSLGSRNKDFIAADIQERNAETQAIQAKENIKFANDAIASTAAIAQASTTAEHTEPATSDLTPDTEMRSNEPVKPAPPNILGEEMPRLTRSHGHFPAGVTWSLVPAGISIEGASAKGTAGEPKTVRKVWEDYGVLCADAAKRYGVPVELIVATIATESSGNPNARRAEPKINDESVGLMQTLVATARSVTGRTTLRGDDLLDPRTSIDAGTAYIASQRGSTHFDPPLVAAAYNAGSLRLDDGDSNRWKLRCFPLGTGAHLDRFVAWFGDAMRVSGDDGWSNSGACPAFAAVLGRIPSTMAIDTTSVDFPPRPAFRPLLTLEDKQASFGKFDFVAAPIAGNPENIKIVGNWEKQNIVNVEIPVRGFLGKAGPLKMRFHRAAQKQLVELWLDWETAGLLDRIVSFDGSFVPRFQRNSTTKLSNHAFGSAFDINAAFNPLGAEPAMFGQKGCVRELVAIANKHGFYWGGHFMTREDGMHFEVAKIA